MELVALEEAGGESGNALPACTGVTEKTAQTCVQQAP